MSGLFFIALRTPWELHSRWVRARGDQVGLLVGELLVGLARVPPGDRALLQEGVVAAVVDRDLVLGQVELDDPGDAAGQELPVVGDQHDAAAQAAHERLQALEAGEVEVVGGLVEQHDVEAAEQQRGQRRPGRLAAGQRRHQGVGADVEAEVGQHRREPVVEVGRTAGQPVVEARRRRRRRRPGSSDPSAAAAASIAAVAPVAPGTAGEVAGDGLARRRARAPAAASRRRRREGAVDTGAGQRRRRRRRGAAAASSCRRRWRRRRRPRRPGRR